MENGEARGFVYLFAARGAPSIFAGLFASVAQNEFARAMADCDAMILGGRLKASSFVSTIGIITGVSIAVIGPFLGTLADITPYRKTLLAGFYISLFLFSLAMAILLLSGESHTVDPENPSEFLPEPLWHSNASLIAIGVFFALGGIAYEGAALLSASLAPELSTDDLKVTRYLGYAYLMMNGSQVVVALFVILLGHLLSWNSFDQGSYGGFISVVYAVCWFFPGYRLIKSRGIGIPKVNKACFGLGHLVDSSREVWTTYPQLAKFLISWSFGNAGAGAISILATTYLQFYLGFSSFLTSCFLALALVFSLPGSLLISMLAQFFSLKRIYVGINILAGVSFFLTPAILIADSVPVSNNSSSGDSQASTQYGMCDTVTAEAGNAFEQVTDDYVVFIVGALCVVWGLLLGGIFTVCNGLFSALVPGGKETTFFSIRVTFASLLTWLPPLLYTTINEKFDHLRWSIVGLGPIFLMAALIGCLIDFDQAKLDIHDTLRYRQGDSWKEYFDQIDHRQIEQRQQGTMGQFVSTNPSVELSPPISLGQVEPSTPTEVKVI